MTPSLLRVSLLLLFSSVHAVDAFPSPPEVLIQHSAFDYPPNFLEIYSRQECHTSPLVVEEDITQSKL